MDRQQYENISKALYLRLCQELGCPTQAEIRKEVMKLQRELYMSESIITAGSYNDGFRFPDSDMDNMVRIKDIRVIFNLSQSDCYDTKNIHQLLTESDGLKPGSVKLKYLSGPNYKYASLCTPCNGALYLFSKDFRASVNVLEGTYEHGPCVSHDGREFGGGEVDVARCLKSDKWPPQAYEWETRSTAKKWPPPDMIHDIIDSGCYFAPVGVKFSKTENMEWRISFAVAESMLVQSLNHCQFLCYGFLKMFLKNTIDKDENTADLLSSYHLKTAVFWEVQETHQLPWVPETLFSCFWRCLERIYTWIQSGNCPNFFIPTNNIFKEKIYGTGRLKLLNEIGKILRDGTRFLLKIPQLRKVYEIQHEHPQLLENVPTDGIRKESDFDETFLEEIVRSSESLGEPKHFHAKLKLLMHLLNEETGVGFGRIRKDTIKIFLFLCLRSLAISIFQTISDRKRTNRQSYFRYKQVRRILESLASLDLTSGKLWIAIYHFLTGNYSKSLRIIEVTTKTLKPHIMYPWYVEHDLYTSMACGQNKPPLEKFQQFVALHVEIPFYFRFPPLQLEQIHAKRRYIPIIVIPPMILGEMLRTFCYKYLKDEVNCKLSLHDLRELVQSVDGFHFHENDRAVPLEILGICEEVCGNHSQAVQAYIQSFQSRPLGYANASIVRILCILYQNFCVARSKY